MQLNLLCPIAVMMATIPSASANLAAQLPPVETAMRTVDFHVDSTLIMHITWLRGRLIAVRPDAPAFFDQPTSFTIDMDTASITLSTRALGDLLNRYVFHYSGSPLGGLHVSIDHGRLKQSGRLHGIPFSIVTTVAVMPNGELRLHPGSIHAIGIGVQGLMHLFGLSLQKLANVRQAPGVRIEKNDLLLTPAAMLPPPKTRGTLVAVSLGDSTLTLVFGRAPAAPALIIPDPAARNYLYFHGGTIRFGHLTMTPADLLVVDQDPRDPFDFWLKRYQQQLVAGDSRTTKANGLITTWPDFKQLRE